MTKPRTKKLNADRYPHSYMYFPSILVHGFWFRDCGFKPGDIIEFTSPQRRTLVMKVYKTYEEQVEERMKREEESRKAMRKLRKRKGKENSFAVEDLQS